MKEKIKFFMQRMQIYFTILCFSFAIDANGSSSSDHPLTESSFSGRRSIFNSPLFNEALLGQFTQDPVSQKNRNLLSDFNSLRISQSGMNSIYSSSSLKSLNQNLILQEALDRLNNYQSSSVHTENTNAYEEMKESIKRANRKIFSYLCIFKNELVKQE